MGRYGSGTPVASRAMRRRPGPTSNSSVLEAALRRDRALVAAGLLGLAALAWVYVAVMAAPAGHERMSMPMASSAVWSAGELCWLGAMWAIKIGALKIPSAPPAILLY